MKRISFLILCTPIFIGLSACSSNQVDTSEVTEAAQEKGGAFHLNEKNPFEWSTEDVQKGQDGNFNGGKRSQFDGRSQSSYAKSRKSPGYLSREYHSAAWNGEKNYGTGSYQGGSKSSDEGKRSWFGWRKNRDAKKVASAAGKDYGTGGYTVGSARESGSAIASPSSDYVKYRQRVGTKPMMIFSQEGYREMSLDQSRGLLGKP